MAWPANGTAKVMTATLIPDLTGSINLAAAGNLVKTTLWANTPTPDNTVTTTAAQYTGAGTTWTTGNELATAGGYTQGGLSLTAANNALTQTTNVLKWTNSTTTQWTSATFSTYGAFNYDSTVVNWGITYHDFSGVQTVTSGTFTITWNASGIFTITT